MIQNGGCSVGKHYGSLKLFLYEATSRDTIGRHIINSVPIQFRDRVEDQIHVQKYFSNSEIFIFWNILSCSPAVVWRKIKHLVQSDIQ